MSSSSSAGQVGGGRRGRSARIAAANAAAHRAASQRAAKRKRSFNNNSNAQPSPSAGIGNHLEKLRVGGRSSSKRRRRNGIRGSSASNHLNRSLSNIHDDIVDLSSPSPKSAHSSSSFHGNNVYGKDSQMKQEQDLAFDIANERNEKMVLGFGDAFNTGARIGNK